MTTFVTEKISVFLLFMTFSFIGQSLNSKIIFYPQKGRNPNLIEESTYKNLDPNIIQIIKKISELKQKNKKELTAPERNEQRKLIGRIIWYANLQDAEGELLIKLTEYCKNYPLLNNELVNLILESNPVENFFFKEKSEFILILKDKGLKLNEKISGELFEFYSDFNKNDSMLTAIKRKYALKMDTVLLKLQKSQIDTSLLANTEFINGQNQINLEVEKLKVDIENLTQKISNIKRSTLDYFKSNSQSLSNFIAKINANESADGVLIPDFSDFKEYRSQAQTDLLINYNYNLSFKPGETFRIPSETEMIDAVAIYLAKRVKQESVMWFFETISKNAKQFDLISTFFPETVKLLNSKEIYDIPNMGVQWRYALSKDFIKLPRNVLESKWLSNKFPEVKSYNTYIDGACSMAEMFMDKKSYREVINGLYMKYKNVKSENQNVEFKDLVTVLYAVNTELSVRDTAKNQYSLLKYEYFRTLTGAQIELMLSLMDMKYDGVFSKLLNNMSVSFKFHEKVTPEKIRLMFGKIENAVSAIEATHKVLVEEISKSKDNLKDNPAEIIYSVNSVWNATNTLLKTFEYDIEKSDLFSERVKEIGSALKCAEQIFDVYNLISKRNYAGAVQQTITIVDQLFYGSELEDYYIVNLKNNKEIQNFSLVKNIMDSIEYGSIKLNELRRISFVGLDSAKQKIMNKKFVEDTIKIHEKLNCLHCQINELSYKLVFDFDLETKEICFKKYNPAAAIFFERDRYAVQLIRKLAGFLNDVSLTTDSKELAKVVESYAMPAGSYKRKRNSWYSFDLNAFAGMYLGRETIPNKSKTPALVYGVSAPIGFSLSRTCGVKLSSDSVHQSFMLNPSKLKFNKNDIYKLSKSTFTLSMSIVDIGAIVSYRFTNPTDSAITQKFKWEQFISPGLHLAWGIPSTPLVIQTGFVYTPLLRKFSTTIPEEQERQYNATRFYLGLFYDLPLFNLHETKRRVKNRK